MSDARSRNIQTPLLTRADWPGHLVAVLAGVICTLSFSPFDIWPLAIVSLISLLTVTQSVKRLTGVLRYYLFGVGLYASGISWVFVSIHVHGGASLLLASFLVLLFALSISLLFAVQGYIYLRFFRLLPFGLLLAFPAVWVLREWVMSWLFSGFPWLLLGYAHIETPLIGFAPVLGVYSLSVLALVTAATLYLQVAKQPAHTGLARTSLVVVAVIWGMGFILSNYEHTAGDRVVTVSAVQGNIDQKTKWTRRMIGPILETYTRLTSSEWGRELIVWPEASITLFRQNAFGQLEKLDKIAGDSGSTLVLGIPGRDSNGGFQNSAVSIGQGSGQYVKRHLVPFGEYVPFESQLRGLITFLDLPMSHNQPGPEKQTPLTAGDLTLSLSICYEVVFGDLVRRTVTDPDILITMSNDTWFGDSIGPWQHFQMARMRAIENGKYMVRATNNGITAIIDHKGRVQGSLPQFEPGVLRGEVRAMKGVTPYAWLGNTPVLGAALLVVLCLIFSGRKPSI